MRYAYPCNLEPDEPGFCVTFPDVPEAITSGDSLKESLAMAEDALATALAGYVHDKRDIPKPATFIKGTQYLIPLSPVVATKLALYTAMRDQGMSKVALAEKLDVSEAAVRKLTNPDHRSHIGQVEKALKILGRKLVIEDKVA